MARPPSLPPDQSWFVSVAGGQGLTILEPAASRLACLVGVGHDVSFGWPCARPEMQPKLGQFAFDHRGLDRHKFAAGGGRQSGFARLARAVQLGDDPAPEADLEGMRGTPAFTRSELRIELASREQGGLRREGELNQIVQIVRRLDLGAQAEEDVAD